MSGKKGKQKASSAPVSRPLANAHGRGKSAWSEDGHFFAYLTAAVDSHTVRIYDVSSGSRCIARWASTSGEKVQSLLWLELPAANAAKRGKKRRKVQEESTEVDPVATSPQTALALGLDNGQISIVHPTTSAVIYQLEDPSGLASSLSALACPTRTEGPTLLWTTDDTGVVRAFSIDASSGRLYGLMAGAGDGYGTALAVRYTAAETAQVLVSRFETRSFEVDLKVSASLDLAQSSHMTAAGHTSEIVALKWLDDAGAFASIAEGDRCVNFWRADGRLGALTTLDNPPQSIDIRDGLILFVTELGAAAILPIPKEIALSSSKNPPASRALVSRIESDIRAARLDGSARATLAKGNALKPIFDSVAFRDDSGAFLPEVQLAPASAVTLIDEDGDVNMGAPVARSAYKEGASKVQSATTALAPEVDATNSGELDVNTAGPTLAQRMKSLKIPAVPDPDAEDADGKERTAFVPQATLTQTLIQALHSDDRELIEACLVHSHPKLVRNTVKRLPNSLVLPLIDSLVERLSKSKRGYGVGAQRGRALIVWLRTCLVVHVGYLVTVEGLADRLASFHSALHHRLEAHNQLLALAGRLDLVVSQIEMRREAAGRPRADLAYDALLGKGNLASPTHVKPPLPVHKYVEGESESSSDDSDDDSDSEDDDEWSGVGMDVDTTKDDGEIDQTGFGLAGDSSDDESDLGDETATRRQHKANGFLELEADEASSASRDDSESESEETESAGDEDASEDDDE